MLVEGAQPALSILSLRHARLLLQAQVDPARRHRGRRGNLLRGLPPATQLFKLAKAIFTDIWEIRRSEASSARATPETQLQETEKQIENLLDRIMNASSPSVIGAYEKRIAELEREKIRLAERAGSAVPEAGRLTEFIEPALTSLASPWNIYKSCSFALKRTVVELAFAEPLRYSQNEGHRAAEITFPFTVVAVSQSLKCGMVGDPGIEPGVGLPGGVTVRCRTLQPVALIWRWILVGRKGVKAKIGPRARRPCGPWGLPAGQGWRMVPALNDWGSEPCRSRNG